jgi:hypothetical protein
VQREDASDIPVFVHITHGRDGWGISMADRAIVCDSLDDALRIAFLAVPGSRSCELIVHDADHRVVRRELMRPRAPAAPASEVRHVRTSHDVGASRRLDGLP